MIRMTKLLAETILGPFLRSTEAISLAGTYRTSIPSDVGSVDVWPPFPTDGGYETCRN